MEFSAEACESEKFEEDFDETDDYYYLSDDNEIEELEKKVSQVPPWLTALFLRKRKWDLQEVEQEFLRNPCSLLSSILLIPQNGYCYTSDAPDFGNVIALINHNQKSNRRSPGIKLKERNTKGEFCPVCLSPPSTLEHLEIAAMSAATASGTELPSTCGGNTSESATSFGPFSAARLYGMSCGHGYCLPCWQAYFEVQVQESNSANIECMDSRCNVCVTDNFVLLVLGESPKAARYRKILQNEMIAAHPRLRPCTNSRCSSVVYALEEPRARKVHCETCGTDFCFACGMEYHAPTDCETIKRWLQKCRDDSGTATYMAAHTKDCPHCGVCIEKNGGCNHMQCSKCHYSFCWVCLGPWQTHSAQFYVCSKYMENADLAKESARNRAREYLKRYFFYYERWENHERSLRLEQEHYATIQSRIQSKVLNCEGTWIDWQYLLTAAETLRKCRYTLKYTYPYAYYPPKAMQRLALFEYQQGLLEAEVEDLSWKIAHAEITDKGELLNKMNICEKHRQTLLQEFLTN
ncbi:hypothetical protein AAHC03_01656 [Spirometra sp. Aus1]